MLKYLPLVDLEQVRDGAPGVGSVARIPAPLRAANGSSCDPDPPSRTGFPDIVSTEFPSVAGWGRAAAGTGPEATDADGRVGIEPASSRTWLVRALSEFGEDPFGLDPLSDEQLRVLYGELSAEPAALAGRAWLVRALSTFGEEPLDLDFLPDEQLRARYAELSVGPRTTEAVAAHP